MKKKAWIQKWVSNYWQAAVYSLGLIGVPLTVLLYNLTGLTDNRLLSIEGAALSSGFDKRSIFENPLDLLFKVPEYAIRFLHLHSLWTVRLVPVFFSLVTILAVYYVAKQWYGQKTAFAVLAMATASSWLLAYGRLATPAIVYPMLISLGLAYGAWIRHARHSGWVMIAGVLLGLAYIYTSGLIWLAILAVIWQRRVILQRIADAPKLTLTILVVVGIGVAPLVLACVLRPELINTIAGLSADPSQSFANAGIKSVDIIQQFAVEGHRYPELGLTRVALLDIFTYVMSVLGLVTLFNQRKLDRFKAVVVTLVVLWFLISLGGPVPIIALFPIIYLLAAGGVGRLLGDWLKVFPRNPLARGIGLGVMGLVVGLSCLYHLQRYFIAWPAAAPTRTMLDQAANNAEYYKSLLQ